MKFEDWVENQKDRAYENIDDLIYTEDFYNKHFHCMKTIWNYQQKRIDKLERELFQQKFNNKHNLSIDEQISQKIMELEAKLKEAVGVIEDMIEQYASIGKARKNGNILINGNWFHNEGLSCLENAFSVLSDLKSMTIFKGDE